MYKLQLLFMENVETKQLTFLLWCEAEAKIWFWNMKVNWNYFQFKGFFFNDLKSFEKFFSLPLRTGRNYNSNLTDSCKSTETVAVG